MRKMNEEIPFSSEWLHAELQQAIDYFKERNKTAFRITRNGDGEFRVIFGEEKDAD
jgi:hypothetical protein